MVAMYGRDGVTPGRVVCLGYDLDTHNGTRMPYPWLYVVAVSGDTVSGVLFNNDRQDTASPRFYGTTFDAIAERNGGRWDTIPSHPLTVVGWWADAVSGYLATPDTFPDVTLPSVAPAPAPDLSGETIAREYIVTALTRASEVASQYASDNALCGEFERCMDAIGLQDLGLRSLRERERQYRVTYTAERETECETCGHETTDTGPADVTLWIEARNDDHALDVLLEDMSHYLTDWDGDGSDVYLERV